MSSYTEVKLAERLASIITQLNDAKTLSISSLAEEFNVSVRTLQRDMNERLSFLPILEDKGHYSLAPSALGKLSPKDIRHFAAISGIESLYPNLDTRFICSILSQAIDSPYLIKGHNYEPKHKVEPNLNKLEEIILDKKCISFKYKDKQYTSIHAYRLVNAKGIWYLAAVDNGKLKTFSVSKMSSVWETKEIFECSPDIEKQILDEETIWFSEEKLEVVLRVSADIADYFTRRQLIPEQEITKTCDDGSLIVTTTVAHEKQILPIIKYWLPHITVISPSSLDEELRLDIRKYIN